MRRGDVVTVALQSEQGKPRSILVVQADAFGELPALTMVPIVPITSTLLEAPLLRVQLEPNAQNGLLRRSQVMVDKPQTPSRARLGSVIGQVEDAGMLQVNRALALFLGLA